MADKTTIEWTDMTWNPIRGCSRVSQGCTHCYAERTAARFSGAGQPYEGLIHPSTGGWNGTIKLVPEALQIPWRLTRGRKIFVNSMSDLFHPDVPFEFIAAVFWVMSVTTRHTYQILTKRPERMLEFFLWLHRRADTVKSMGSRDAGWWMSDVIGEIGLKVPAIQALGWEPATSRRGGYDNCGPGWPYANVWLGVSVEDQATAVERIPLLLQCPAAVRWISAEPLLGPLDLTQVHCVPHNAAVNTLDCKTPQGYVRCVDHAAGHCLSDCRGRWPAIDWVVTGGESGPSARPMHPYWARSLRDQCAAAGVPFLFKQWGAWLDGDQAEAEAFTIDELSVHEWPHAPLALAPWSVRVGKKAAGRTLDGIQHDGYPAAAS